MKLLFADDTTLSGKGQDPEEAAEVLIFCLIRPKVGS